MNVNIVIADATVITIIIPVIVIVLFCESHDVSYRDDEGVTGEDTPCDIRNEACDSTVTDRLNLQEVRYLRRN